MGKHGYWICTRPTSGNAKGWRDMDHADIITDAMSPDQWGKLIEKYNARVDAYNKDEHDGVPLTHPTVTGAEFCAGNRAVSLVTRRWIVDIRFVRGFNWWPGHWALVTDQATIKRENVKRLDLHWANGAEDEFYKWLNDPIVLEPRK